MGELTCFDCAVLALCEYGCQTSAQIKTLIYRMFNLSFSVSEIGAVLRKLKEQGAVASSENEYGKKVY